MEHRISLLLAMAGFTSALYGSDVPQLQNNKKHVSVQQSEQPNKKAKIDAPGENEEPDLQPSVFKQPYSRVNIFGQPPSLPNGSLILTSMKCEIPANIIRFSPDNQHFLIVFSEKNEANLLSRASGKFVKAFIGKASPYKMYDAGFSADGKRLLTASSDSRARLWDVKTGKNIKTLKGSNHDSMRTIAINAHGTHALVGSRSKKVHYWDITTTDHDRKLIGHTRSLRAVAISPDGKYALTGGEDCSVRYWNLTQEDANLCLLKMLKGHMSYVLSVSFNADGRYALTASSDKTAILWDLDTGEKRMVLTGHTKSVIEAIFSPDGKKALTASDDGTVRIWDLTTGDVLKILNDHSDSILSMSMSSDRELLATSSRDGSIIFYNLEVILRSTSMHQVNLTNSPVVDLNVNNAEKEKEIELINIDKTDGVHADSITGLYFDKVRNLIISASRDKTVKIWDAKTGICKETLTEHENPITALCRKEETSIIASVEANSKTIKLWSPHSFKCLASFSKARSDIGALCYAGNSLVAAAGKHLIVFTDCYMGPVSSSYIRNAHGKEITSVCYDSGNKQLITASKDCTVKLWSLAGDCLKELGNDDLTHIDFVWAVAVDTEHDIIISASADKTIRLWDAKTGNHIKTFKGHEKAVKCLCCVPKNNIIISGSADKTIKVWDANSGKCLDTFTGHTDSVDALCYDDSSNRIISASADGQIRIWQLSKHVQPIEK